MFLDAIVNANKSPLLTVFEFVENAPHLFLPTASCLISRADKKIKIISSLLTSPSRHCLVSYGLPFANQ